MNSFSENQPPNQAASPYVEQLLATGISAIFFLRQTLNELMQQNYIPLNHVLEDFLRSSVKAIDDMYVKLRYEAECYRDIPQCLQVALATEQYWIIPKNLMEIILTNYHNMLEIDGEGIYYHDFQ
ncbi:uncharacterized protein LOC131264060 [Anopheles coustani]|uniref:uncharacterized protein LOC131264060 n=1 Tax=Anopheles coustani TaxID=139045 RepID=UPI002659D9E1|nr:uncharacterized protein LOC131264060 [Anopheles coustani]